MANELSRSSSQRFMNNPPKIMQVGNYFGDDNISLHTGEEFSTEFLRDRFLPRRTANEHNHHTSTRVGFNEHNQNRRDSENRMDSRFSTDANNDPSMKIKLLCSFGGRILPRPGDGKLRYVGGENKIISINENSNFNELVKKTSAMSNQIHIIKYELPGEDLDALISVSSDEDLHHMMEECYDLARVSQRLRIFLIPPNESENPGSLDSDSQFVYAVNGIHETGSSCQSYQWGSSMDYSNNPVIQRESSQFATSYQIPPKVHNQSPPLSPVTLRNQEPKTSNYYMDQLSYGESYYTDPISNHYHKPLEPDLSHESRFHNPNLKRESTSSAPHSTRIPHAHSDSHLQFDERDIVQLSNNMIPKHQSNFVTSTSGAPVLRTSGHNKEEINWGLDERLFLQDPGGQMPVSFDPAAHDLGEHHNEYFFQFDGQRVTKEDSHRELDSHQKNPFTDEHTSENDYHHNGNPFESPTSHCGGNLEFRVDYFESSTSGDENVVSLRSSDNLPNRSSMQEPMLIVEDVTGHVPADIPSSSSVIPLVQVQSLEENKCSRITDTDSFYEYDLQFIRGGDSVQDASTSDAAVAEMEAGVYGLQIIKYADVEELQELGSGTFGTVYHGKWRGTDVAIKKIKKSCFSGSLAEQEKMTKDFWREAHILSKLHHPNVVAFYGVVPDGPGGTLATVTEYMFSGSLRNVLMRKHRILDKRKKLLIAMDAAFGMEYLHMKSIVHFDLKCENLLVNLGDHQRPICKVGDFGLSRIKRNTLVSGGVRGTLPWMAPELLDGNSNRVSEKVDVYSFGITMWEILTGEEPYANMHCGVIIGGIVSNTLRPRIPEECDPEWKELIEKCWSPNPATRPSFTQVANRLRLMSIALQPTKHV
ncbi:uncharacterized protein LOC124934512 [Impatiens glandulifera]|uniref:uncharacterized protein LOC124934512 n=1 Tax=Impatiens glandulifera TaxID=253017 RepID=UPI001FB061AC|nr:uncharacterized protein LOC124934512 [Impatiens glandulifera]